MPSLFETLLGEATQLTRNGNLMEATAAIQRALLGAGAADPGPATPSGGGADVLDGLVREVPASPARPARKVRPVPSDARAAPTSADPGRRPARDGTFEAGTYSGRYGTRTYKLFVPAERGARPPPLVVMLHGCSQSPDDFAAGTRMNEIAAERGFLVLYPAQAPRSNHSKCWNWFAPGDQRRDAGEPGLLADMTRQVMGAHGVDADRVYVAGLSAGAAMADILGREYPDLYAAVGVHSGLPQGAAHDVASAFTAMHHGPHPHGSTMPFDGLRAAADRTGNSGARRTQPGAPTIVFHGDADGTVHASNGDEVVDAALRAAGQPRGAVQKTALKSSAGGRAFTRTVYRRAESSADAASLAEHWVVHGAGHAWSGGSPTGSYADAGGPDASREMIRFFEEHPLRRATAAR